MSTPIRLVRSDGELIDLMATNITLNVDRSVNPHAIPGKGANRYAFDLNLPKALISIEGVITDADNIPSLSQFTEATARVNFELQRGSLSSTWLSQYDADGSDFVDSSVYTTSNFIMRLNDNNDKVHFVKRAGASTHGGSGTDWWVSVYNTSTNAFDNEEDIALSLMNLINSNITNLNAVRYSANTGVEMTWSGQGANGNQNHPSFPSWKKKKFTHERFSGGRTSSGNIQKSAGDKVAELFAVLNNSNNFTFATATTKNILSYGTRNVGVVGGGNNNPDGNFRRSSRYGDYIIGIQIPFTSTVNSNSSLFYMPTGPGVLKEEKEVANAEPVGTEFNPIRPQYTGIKGTITQASFNQIGGEPLFSYTIQFVPVDFIY
tara:strand:- start:315 stop:1442 length:1128 start_codon:yes stop_codon:yes gene_type:complete